MTGVITFYIQQKVQSKPQSNR